MINRRAFDSKTGKEIRLNPMSYDSLMVDAEFITYCYSSLSLDLTSIESLNLALRTLAREYELDQYPIKHPKTGELIWGFEPVRVNHKTNYVEIRFNTRADLVY